MIKAKHVNELPAVNSMPVNCHFKERKVVPLCSSRVTRGLLRLIPKLDDILSSFGCLNVVPGCSQVWERSEARTWIDLTELGMHEVDRFDPSFEYRLLCDNKQLIDASMGYNFCVLRWRKTAYTIAIYRIQSFLRKRMIHLQVEKFR